jgi:hypothetical protein
LKQSFNVSATAGTEPYNWKPALSVESFISQRMHLGASGLTFYDDDVVTSFHHMRKERMRCSSSLLGKSKLKPEID